MSKLSKLLDFILFRKKTVTKPQYQCEICKNAYDFKYMNFFSGCDYQVYAAECICDKCLDYLNS